jgi:hypothetical protein
MIHPNTSNHTKYIQSHQIHPHTPTRQIHPITPTRQIHPLTPNTSNHTHPLTKIKGRGS